MEDYINFKIIVLGAQEQYSWVGKSSLILRYIKGEFSEQYNVTVGVEYSSKIVQIDPNTIVRLQIWDTAGQELFRAVVRSFYKGISAVFLLYAINKEQTFIDLKNWMNEVHQHAHQEVVVFMIGAKADLQEEREVSIQRATAFLKQIGAVFFLETSSKTGDRIQTLFEKASEILYKKYISNGSFRNLVRPMLASGATTRTESKKLIEPPKKQQKKKCC